MKKLLFILLGLASLNVYAHSCGGEYQPATGTCRIIDSSGYGAWAVNLKTGIAGGALNMDSREAAEKEAIKTCEKGGRNAPCIVSAWVRNGCIAVAQGNEGKQSRVFSGTTKPGRAEVEALRKCQAAGVPQCKIVVSEACSLPRY